MRKIESQFFRTLGILVALAIVLTLVTASASAQTYPTKPVRLLVPFPPGGGADVVARPIATKLSERLGKQVFIDNRGGGGSVIGSEIVAKADPDGYTLLISGNTFLISHELRRHSPKKLPYDTMKSFTQIAKVGTGPTLLSVHPNLPAKSIKELIALAKEKPGKLIFASSGMGSGNHMAMELLKIMAKIDFKIVHFKGAGPAMTDLLGGHADAIFATIVQTLPHVKSGKIRTLGTGGKKRSASLPDLPTIAEDGVPEFAADQWWGIWAPAGTPAPIVDRLNKELKVILGLDEIKGWFLKQGAEVDYLSPTEFLAFLEEETSRWARVVKEANIKME